MTNYHGDGSDDDDILSTWYQSEDRDVPERSTQYPADAPQITQRPPPPDTSRTWVGPREEPTRYALSSDAVISGGAEGTIFRAEFIGQGGGNPTPVAIKEYRVPRGASSRWPHDGTWLQINDQANMLRSLPENPHVVKIREVILGAKSSTATDLDPNSTAKAFETPFLVMEWISGESPESVMERGPVPVSVRLNWIEDLAAAVEQLHSLTHTFGNPLVHGDIKPANCLINPERGLVLLDTGALHRADRPGNQRGLLSPPWAAPEAQLDPLQPRTEATDYFSLGAVAVFFLTGQKPPDSKRATYLPEVRAVLRQGQWLSRCRNDAARNRATDLVTTLLAVDPRERTAVSAKDWAGQLRDLVQPPHRWRPQQRLRMRWPTLSVAALIVVALTATGVIIANQGSSDSAGAACPASDTASPHEPASAQVSAPTALPDAIGGSELNWAALPAFAAGGGRSLYSHSFDSESSEWPRIAVGAVTTRYVCSEYELHAAEPGLSATVPAPNDISRSDEVVTATASINGGQGGWEIWCRGSDTAGSQRYDFVISHTGNVQITEPGGTGTGWHHLSGIDVAAPVTLTARCADVPGAPVELMLAVNGRTALTYVPTGALLGPGYAGIGVFSFSDVVGPTMSARFTQFELDLPS